MAIFATLTFLAVHTWAGGCSVWMWLGGLVFVWFTFIGDWINVVYLGSRIAAAKRERARA